MSRRRLSLVVLLLLLAVGAGVWVAFLDDAPEPARSGVEETPPPGETPRDPARRAAGRRTEDPRVAEEAAPPVSKHGAEPTAPTDPAAPPSSRDVRLRVVTAEGTPAEGASVEIWADVGTLGPDAEKSANRAKGTTDAEGRVTVALRGYAGYAHAVWRDQAGVSDLDLSREEETTVVLGPAATVRVRVLGPLDAPVAGAVVRISWWRRVTDDDFDHAALLGRTGEDGRVEFASVPTGRSEHSGTDVEVWARGHAPGETSADDEDLDEEIVVRLAAASTVRGRCIDERNRPVAGVSVQPHGVAGESVVTDADGRFAIEGIPREGASVRFQSDAHAPTALTDLVIPAAEHDVGDVLLRAGGKVTGVFVDLDGKPVAGGHVGITDTGLEWTYRSVVVGEDGRFTFDHVPPGPQTLTGTEPRVEGESWSATREATLGDVRADGGETKLVLTGALFLHIRFLDAGDRSPVKVGSADVTVVPLAGDTDGGGGWGWSGGQIDSVRFEIAEAGPYRVEVEVPGYEKAVVDKVEILPDREVRIDVLFRKRP